MAEVKLAELFAACQTGDVGKLARMLEEAKEAADFSLDAPVFVSEMTLLMVACKSGQAAVARDLIDRGADVGVESGGMTALDYAATYSTNAETLQLLLMAGADANRPDSAGTPPLTAAVMVSYVVSDQERAGRVAAEKVRALLAAGADASYKDPAGATAGAWAQARGYDEAARLLEDAAA